MTVADALDSEVSAMAAREEEELVDVRKSPKYFPARRFPSPSRTRMASTFGNNGGNT